MKRRQKEVALLLLPVAALLGFSVLFPALQEKPKGTLTLASIKVTKIAKPLSDGSDVEVHAQFNYSQTLQERFLYPNWSMTLTNAYILDGTGKKHYMIDRVPDGQQSIVPSLWSRDSANYLLPLRNFPKSAGRLTFHFMAVAHDGFKLPVSVVVRN